MTPTSEDARDQLDRILASPGFASSERMSHFLRYVVERTLAGESEQLKEYTIGVEVFGRNGDYDPRLDSIVRVEARRLRSKLDEYYAAAGTRDPIVIRLPKGGYIPVFGSSTVMPAADNLAIPVEHVVESPRTASRQWRVAAAGTTVLLLALVATAAIRGRLGSANEPSAAVLPLASYSTDEAERLLAAQLTDGVTRELARLGTIGIVSHTSARRFTDAQAPAPEIGRALGAAWLVVGSMVKSGDRVDVSIRLVKSDVDRKTWVQDFTGTTATLGELERRIAEAVALEIPRQH